MSITDAAPPETAAADLVMAAAPQLPMLLAPLERFLLDCETPASPMIIRVILRFTGECRTELLRSAYHRALARHPLLTSRLAGKGSRLHWVAGSPNPLSFRSSEKSVFENESGADDTVIRLKEECGLRVSAVTTPDGLKIILDTHHAVADGNGLRQLITDWFHLYHCSVRSLPPRLPPLEPEKLQSRHLFPQPVNVEKIGLREALRNFYVTIRGKTARWKKSGNTRRFSSISHCEEVILTSQQCESIHRNLDRHGLILNDFVLAGALRSFARLAPQTSSSERITVLNPTDLRRPSDRTLPAANRFGIAFLRRTRSECDDRQALFEGIDREMKYVRSAWIGVEFLRGLELVSRFPFGVRFFRRIGCFVPSMQWTCLGDVTRGAKRLMDWNNGSVFTGDLKFELATGIAPLADNVPISIATCEVGPRLTLSVRTNPAFLDQKTSAEFMQNLIRELVDEP